MKKDKYKILVLSDLKKSTDAVLKSTVSLAKMVGGDIQLYYVKKPTDIVARDNQLSAIRTINSEYRKTEKKIQHVINPISNEFGINIQYAFAFGNVKDEILSHINQQKPDIIVLGKQNPKAFKLIGENITELVLKNFKGIIMIADDKNGLEPNQDLSLGVLNNFEEPFNIEFANSLLAHTQKPLKSFKIVQNSNKTKKRQNQNTATNTLEYVFEPNTDALKNISKYLLKSNVNLLFLDRDTSSKPVPQVNSNIKDIIKQLHVSVLLNNQSTQVAQ